jgi:hypothetical protein
VATPGGFGTPAFGPDVAVVRVAAGRLVVERGGSRTTTDIEGATLRELAALAGADLDAPFEVGHDTPPLGDPDEPLAFDRASAVALGTWYAFGWRVLDEALAAVDSGSRVQLWPEHFDAGCDVPAGTERCNLGASPGDGFSSEPYLYVGPWGTDRPGDARYWNAPFGAVLARPALAAADDPVAVGVEFLLRGVRLLTGR